MRSFLSSDGQELNLSGTRDEWRHFSAALTAGQLAFPLDDQGDATAYGHFAKRLVIEPTDERVGFFLVAPGHELRFVATPLGLQRLAECSEELAEGADIPSPTAPHIHFDWVSFRDILTENGPDMVLELIR